MLGFRKCLKYGSPVTQVSTALWVLPANKEVVAAKLELFGLSARHFVWRYYVPQYTVEYCKIMSSLGWSENNVSLPGQPPNNLMLHASWLSGFHQASQYHIPTLARKYRYLAPKLSSNWQLRHLGLLKSMLCNCHCNPYVKDRDLEPKAPTPGRKHPESKPLNPHTPKPRN